MYFFHVIYEVLHFLRYILPFIYRCPALMLALRSSNGCLLLQAGPLRPDRGRGSLKPLEIYCGTLTFFKQFFINCIFTEKGTPMET